jgi:hypothetical protein
VRESSTIATRNIPDITDGGVTMDEKEFKKHLRDLAHGRHNLAEHDWGTPGKGKQKAKRPTAKAKSQK